MSSGHSGRSCKECKHWPLRLRLAPYETAYAERVELTMAIRPSESDTQPREVHLLCDIRELASQPGLTRRLGRCFRLASRSMTGGTPVAKDTYWEKEAASMDQCRVPIL
jgi:hypothetical protein